MKNLTYIILFLSLLLFNSCSFLLGFKKHKYLSEAEILKTSRKLKIPMAQTYIIKDSLYQASFLHLEKQHPKNFNDAFQPLQVKVYHKGNVDTTAAFLINCNIGGFPNLNWNRLNSFEEFPIAQKQLIKPNISFSLKNELEYIESFENKKITYAKFEENDINIFVYWSKYTYRHSKQLIKLIKGYQEKFNSKKIAVFFVNIDNIVPSYD